MSELRIQRFLTVDIPLLREDRDDGHEHTQKTVLEDTGPNNLDSQLAPCKQWIDNRKASISYIKPGQPAPWGPPNSMFSAATFLQP